MEKVSVKIVNTEGKEVGKLDLDPAVFDAPIQENLVQETVRWQLAKRRAGTHQALTRSMMVASNKKPWKQKGTGRARAGSVVSPLWVGGASVHGPLPRSYEYRLPKRTRRQALASLLSKKLKDNSLVIVDSLAEVSGKTKDMQAALGKLGVDKKGAILILNAAAKMAWRSSRNLARVLPTDVSGVNVYDLMRHHLLVAGKEEILALQNRVLQEPSNDKKADSKKGNSKKA